MKKQKKVTFLVLLITILMVGIGYAALSNVTLNITGNAVATASNENFKVYFTAENTVRGEVDGGDPDVTVGVTAKSQNATVDFKGLTKKGDTKYAILEILNDSNDVNATSVNVTTTTSTGAEGIISVEAVMCDATGAAIENYAVASGSKTYVKVSAELLVTPTVDATAAITVQITAIPAEA